MKSVSVFCFLAGAVSAFGSAKAQPKFSDLQLYGDAAMTFVTEHPVTREQTFHMEIKQVGFSDYTREGVLVYKCDDKGSSVRIKLGGRYSSFDLLSANTHNGYKGEPGKRRKMRIGEQVVELSPDDLLRKQFLERLAQGEQFAVGLTAFQVEEVPRAVNLYLSICSTYDF